MNQQADNQYKAYPWGKNVSFMLLAYGGTALVMAQAGLLQPPPSLIPTTIFVVATVLLIGVANHVQPRQFIDHVFAAMIAMAVIGAAFFASAVLSEGAGV